MSDDIDLSAFGSIASALVADTTHFYTNLPFHHDLRVTANVKFPGTMVVALSRDMLPMMKGLQTRKSFHTRDQVSKFLTVKPISFPQFHFPKPVKKECPIVESIEFADSSGCFDPWYTIYIPDDQVEFVF